MYLEGSLTLCPFSKVIVYSPLGFVSSPATDSWLGLQYQAWIPSVKKFLNPLRKQLVSPEHLSHYCTHAWSGFTVR